jgi:hypothetical protein
MIVYDTYFVMQKLRQVPSKLINEERKLHRLETRDIRLLMEKVARFVACLDRVHVTTESERY